MEDKREAQLSSDLRERGGGGFGGGQGCQSPQFNRPQQQQLVVNCCRVSVSVQLGSHSTN